MMHGAVPYNRRQTEISATDTATARLVLPLVQAEAEGGRRYPGLLVELWISAPADAASLDSSRSVLGRSTPSPVQWREAGQAGKQQA